MNTPGIAGLCERLRKRATASFEANKNFGRKGREWAIDTEVEWQAANILERQAAEIKKLREEVKYQRNMVGQTQSDICPVDPADTWRK